VVYFFVLAYQGSPGKYTACSDSAICMLQRHFI